METERGVSQRTIKVEFQPTRRQQERLQGMFRAARDCYNTLVKYVKYLQQNHHSIRACRLLAAQVLVVHSIKNPSQANTQVMKMH
jgi:hypothetical protein